MPNKKHLDSGKTFMEKVIAALPEDQREAVSTAILGSESALALVGEGAMLRPEFSKTMNDLQTQTEEVRKYKSDLDAWFVNKKAEIDSVPTLQAKIAELEKAGGRGGSGRNGDDDDDGEGTHAPALTKDALIKLGIDPDKLLTEERAAALMEKNAEGMLAFYREANPLTLEHYKTFGEVLNVEEILTHPKVRDLGFKATYLQLHKDKFEELATKKQEAHDKAVGDHAVAEYQKSHGALGLPGVVRSMPTGQVSPLDHLEAALKQPNKDGHNTPPGPGHENPGQITDTVDLAVSQFMERAAELGRSTARL